MKIETPLIYVIEVFKVLENWSPVMCAVVKPELLSEHWDEFEDLEECEQCFEENALELGGHISEIEESYSILKDVLSSIGTKLEKAVRHFAFHISLRGGDVTVNLTPSGRYWIEKDIKPWADQIDRKEVELVYKTIETMMPEWVPEIRYIHVPE